MVDMTFSSRYRNGQILFLTFKKYITEFYAVSSGTSVLVPSHLSPLSEYMGHSAGFAWQYELGIEITLFPPREIALDVDIFLTTTNQKPNAYL